MPGPHDFLVRLLRIKLKPFHCRRGSTRRSSERGRDRFPKVCTSDRAAPHSYALAVTHTTARAYELTSRETIEADANAYRTSIRGQHVNSVLGNSLYHELLGPVAELQDHTTLILIPDGDLHLLPFGAIPMNGAPAVETYTIATCPSSTVFSILRSKQQKEADPPLLILAWQLG